MNKKHVFPIAISALAVGALMALIFLPAIGTGSNPELDGFAQCLAEKGVTMYGAEWCSHCQNQKRMFGDSFEHVPYVECPRQTNLCIERGIEGYPTWIFPDGTKLVGEQELDALAEKSGCRLP